MEYILDSWGRLDSMVYPDGETVKYAYGYGGQLKRMEGTKSGQQYLYLEDIRYDKFGAKTYVKYGNGMEISSTYNSQNLRLLSQNHSLGGYLSFSGGTLTWQANNYLRTN